MSPQDIPAGPDALVQSYWAGPQHPLFAHTHVTHVGEGLGLILAKTPAAAQAGASNVRVMYGLVTSSSSNGGSSGESGAEKDAAGVASGAVHEGASAGADVSSALTSLAAAVAADSWFSLEKFPGTDKASAGEGNSATQAPWYCPLSYPPPPIQHDHTVHACSLDDRALKLVSRQQGQVVTASHNHLGCIKAELDLMSQHHVSSLAHLWVSLRCV